MPEAGVYLVKFSSIAARAAAFTGSGVLKSGSPAPKSTMSMPARRNRSTVAVIAIVGDAVICFVRSASRPIVPPWPRPPKGGDYVRSPRRLPCANGLRRQLFAQPRFHHVWHQAVHAAAEGEHFL